VTSARAIVEGIAPDGGLYVPRSIPTFSYERIKKMQDYSYPQLAAAILAPYLPDFTEKELIQAADLAYSGERFTHFAICPLVPVTKGLYSLELWHGPTSAFKDMALQILPRLLTAARAKCGEDRETVILVATSGDTGKAALEGFRDVAGSRVMVFYPHEGVSLVQKLQMTTQEGNNVSVAAVYGNFDDAQKGVKKLFADGEFQRHLDHHGFALSSANSINWGRLVPQIAYYFSAYYALLSKKIIRDGETINLVVPTGNFGNILAAWYARSMGLPVHKLLCGTNANSILADFIRTGGYDTHRSFYKTQSPSMDILVSSNLERLLFAAAGQDAEAVRAWMKALTEQGSYTINGEPLQRIQSVFWAGTASEEETTAALKRAYEQDRYLMDPHTAVGYHVSRTYQEVTGDNRITILAATASPFKFSHSVAKALGLKLPVQELDGLKALADFSGWTVPDHLTALSEKAIRHEAVCRPEQMEAMVRQFLDIQ